MVSLANKVQSFFHSLTFMEFFLTYAAHQPHILWGKKNKRVCNSYLYSNTINTVNLNA